MSAKTPFSKQQLDTYLNELGKEFRRLTKRKSEAELILVGGAAILINYTFRDATTDADAIILGASAMDDAIRNVGNKFELLPGWLNTDFSKTASYTPKLREYSKPYRTFSNVLHVRTVADEYLVAMKLMAGRQYKHDLSDIVGILWEHEKNGAPLGRTQIDSAINTLYENKPLPDITRQLLDDIFNHGDLQSVYSELQKQEEEARDILRIFESEYPNTLTADTIDNVLEQMKKRKANLHGEM
jgi:hypothetical protein